MIRQHLQRWLSGPLKQLAKRYDAAPKKENVIRSLDQLYEQILSENTEKGKIISLDPSSRFIIFSDLHKGRKNGSDDFRKAEATYLKALDYYYRKGYHLILLGDCEELWENLIWQVIRSNVDSIRKEKMFTYENKLIKITGNHDVFWKNDPFAPFYMKYMYGKLIPVYDGVILERINTGKTIRFFLTHGHQGDKRGEGKIAAWFVARVWAPIQNYLHINPNTPAFKKQLKTAHNRMMYEWSKEKANTILVTGHTHQPVFSSLTHLERLYKDYEQAETRRDGETMKKVRTEIEFRKEEYDHVSLNYSTIHPSYFNTGCCCYDDGDITGIELTDEDIKLIKWHRQNTIPERIVLESKPLSELIRELSEPN